MDDTNDILDAPLETPPSSNRSTVNPALRTIINADFAINVFLLFLAIIASLATIISKDDAIFLFLIALFFLGVYQLLSALVGGLRGNRKKLIYLVVALAYAIVLLMNIDRLSQFFPGKTEEIAVGFFLGVIPLTGAFYYTKLCKDAKKVQF